MKIKDKFTDLTGIGIKQDYGDWFITNEKVLKFDPSRFNFYIQYLDSPLPAQNLFKIVNLNKQEYKELNDNLEAINNYIINNKEGTDNLIEKINNSLQKNINTSNIKAEIDSTNSPKSAGGSNTTQYQRLPDGETGINKYTKNIGIDKEFNENDWIKEDNGRISLKNEEIENIKKDKDKILQTYNNSLEYGPKAEMVHMSDRVIFIIATYILRAIASFMVEWGVHINYINNFVKAFALYFGVYSCIFLVLFILTNVSEKDMVFRMLFFYINTQSEGGKGLLRVFIHLVCIMFLFPIPFIVREYREMKSKTLSFTEKRSIINAVNKFTMLTWILTSIVALRL